MAIVRKEVHLPPDIVRDMKIVCAYLDKTPKKYMEELITNDVRERAKKLKK